MKINFTIKEGPKPGDWITASEFHPGKKSFEHMGKLRAWKFHHIEDDFVHVKEGTLGPLDSTKYNPANYIIIPEGLEDKYIYNQ